MSDLVALLEALDGTPPASLSDTELTNTLQSLIVLRDTVTAELRSVAGEWDQRLVWASDGARSGAAWLARNTELSRGAAASEVRVAKRLRTMPAVAAASRSGTLGAEKVAAITHTVDRDHTGQLAELFARSETQLVQDAKTLSVDACRAAVRYWRHCAHDTIAKTDADLQHDQRDLRCNRNFDGSWHLEGQLEPLTGEMLNNRLNQQMDKLHRAEQTTPGDGATGTTPGQRRADALIELIRAAPAADTTDDDATNRPLPLIVIDVPLETLEDLSGQHASLHDGTTVPPETLSRLICETGLASIITRAGHLTIDLGRTTHEPNRGQRRALAKRDRHCTFPGCDRPATWCDAHHLWPWDKGGPTALWNLTLICRFHHHLVHEGGFRHLADPGGHLHTYRPDGTEIHAPPSREPQHHHIDPRPPHTHIPPEWTAPGHDHTTPPGTAPPGGWDPNHPPDPDIDELAYRRWQDAAVHHRLQQLINRRATA
jgi:hypothetical protein